MSGLLFVREESDEPTQAEEDAAPDRACLVEELFRFLDGWSERYRAATGEAVNLPLATSFLGDPKHRPMWMVQDLAGDIYAARRARDRVFDDPELFGEPVWDILLDLASAAASGKRLPVSSAGIGSCAPASTALRWLKILEDRGLVCRENDPRDGRRTFVALTRLGAEKMARYFAELAQRREGETLFFRK